LRRGWVNQDIDGVVGVAKREESGWAVQPPLIEALGVKPLMPPFSGSAWLATI
jgi:hypothetical protein